MLKDDVAVLKVDFLRMEGRMHNSSLHNPYLRITAIPVYQPTVGLMLPEKFPPTAYAFYELKTPSWKQLDLLIYLVTFYDIQGYENWEQADAVSCGESIRSSSEDIPKEKPTLEDAVKKYPSMAVEALGSLVGLVEDNFIGY